MSHPITSIRSDPVQHVPQLVTSIPSAATCQGPGWNSVFMCGGCLDFGAWMLKNLGIARFAGGSSLTIEIRISQSKDDKDVAYREPHS